MKNFFKLEAKRSIIAMLRLAGIVVLVAAVGFGFTACGDDNGNGVCGNDVVIPIEYRGTWVGTGNIEGRPLTITDTTVRGDGPTHTINRFFPSVGFGSDLGVEVEYDGDGGGSTLAHIRVRILNNNLVVNHSSLEGISTGTYNKQD